MKNKTAFALGAAVAALGAAAGSVAAKRLRGVNVVDEMDARIPTPLFPKKAEKVDEPAEAAPEAESK